MEGGGLLECAPVERFALPVNDTTTSADSPAAAATAPGSNSGDTGSTLVVSGSDSSGVAPPPLDLDLGAAGGRVPCALPFMFGGRNRSDCVWVAGVEACKVRGGGYGWCTYYALRTTHS